MVQKVKRPYTRSQDHLDAEDAADLTAREWATVEYLRLLHLEALRTIRRGQRVSGYGKIGASPATLAGHVSAEMAPAASHLAAGCAAVEGGDCPTPEAPDLSFVAVK